MGLDRREGEYLVRRARDVIQSRLIGEQPPPAAEVSPGLTEKRGAFVTIRTHPENRLRGCIGFPEPIYPLHVAVERAALAAAFEDPRFPPLTLRELPVITIEVSVLSPLKRLKPESAEDLPKMIVIGRDGLVVRKTPFSGLLLPQVPVEEGWGPLEFLDYSCLKAGMEPGCWRDPGVEVYSFTAQIFAEESPLGNIVEIRLSESGGG